MTSSMPELADASSYQPGRQIEREREKERPWRREGGEEEGREGEHWKFRVTTSEYA